MKLNKIIFLFNKLGVDRAIFYTSLARIIMAIAGVITIFFVARFLTDIEQGFYYTFGSVLAIQVFFELGFNGIITQRNFDPGTLVGANNSKPLLIVENIESLRLRVPVPEEYTMAIPDTSVIKFTVDAQPGKIYTAILSRKSGSVNLINRTEIWEYIYQNRDNQLKSGMFATASIRFRRKELSFLVPESAVVTNLEKRFVIRLRDNKAELIDVKNGISQDDKIEIFGMLSEGDTLLLRGTDEIKPGTKLFGKKLMNSTIR